MEMAARCGYSAALSLDPRLAELLRLRVAQLDPCPHCLILHARVADELGIPAEVVARLSGWRESVLAGREGRARLLRGSHTYDIARFPELHDALGHISTSRTSPRSPR